MIIACPECGARYNLPDEKIAGGAVKVKCKKCEAVFRVAPDGSTTAQGAKPAPQPAPAPPADDFGFDDFDAGGQGASSEGSDDEFGFGDDFDVSAGAGAASPDTEQGADAPGADDFDFGDDFGADFDAGAPESTPAGETAPADDFDFGDDFGASDDPADQTASASAAAPGDDEFDFGDDFSALASTDTPGGSEPSQQELDALFDEDQDDTAPADAFQDDEEGEALDDGAFGFDDEDVFYDEDFEDESFDREIEQQIEGEATGDTGSAEAATAGETAEITGELFGDGGADDDLLSTLEQLSRSTGQERKFPLMPVVAVLVVLLLGTAGAMYFAPAVMTRIPLLGQATLALHESLDTEYHRHKVLETRLADVRARIETWVPQQVEDAWGPLNELNRVLSGRSDVERLVGDAWFFLRALAGRKTLQPLPGKVADSAAQALILAADGKKVATGDGALRLALAAAWSAYRQGDVSAALSGITTLTSQPVPVGLFAAVGAAWIYRDIGDEQGWLVSLQQATGLQPENPWLNLLWADAIWQVRQAAAEVEKTLSAARPHVARLSRDNQVRFYELGARAALATRNLALSGRYIEDGLKGVGPNAILLTLKARRALETKQWADANLLIEEAVKLDPGNIEAQIVRAQALARIGRTDEALNALEKLAQKYPSRSEIHTALFSLLLEFNRLDEAEEAYRRAAQVLGDDPDIVRAGAEIALRRNDIKAAQQRLDAFRQHHPGDAMVLLQLAEINYQLGRLDAAANQLRELIQLQPDSAMARVQLGKVLLARKDYVAAEKVLTEALALDTSQAQTYVLLGQAYLEQKKFPEANEALIEAMRLAPNLWQVHLQLGRLRVAEGKLREGLVSIEKAVELSGGAIEALLWNARVYEMLQRPGKALEVYRKILERDPRHREAIEKLARGYVAVEDWPEAAEFLERWKKLEPGNGDVYLLMGQMYNAQGKYDDAIHILKGGVRRLPRSAKLHSELGWALLKKRNLRQAKVELTLAARLDPSHALTQYRLGFLYKEQGRRTDARRAFRKALRLGGLPESVRLQAEQELQALAY